MKPRWSLAILLVVAALLAAGPAQAWDEAKTKADVQGLLDQVAASFDKKDVKSVLAHSTPEAAIKYRDGRSLGMAQWGERVARDLADWQEPKSKFAVEQAWPKGKSQIGVVYTERHDFTRASDPGHQYAIAARFRAYLTRTGQGLRFAEFHDLGTVFTRDGKPVGLKPAKPVKAAKAPAKAK
ncbi:MAG: hypothetical protein V1797_19190 [Pseudomonadota bacterium]